MVDCGVPNCGAVAVDETKLLASSVQNINCTTLVGGLNATTTIKSYGSVTTPSLTAVLTSDAGLLMRSGAVAGSWLVVAILLLL
jgi:hypothetical protein